MVVQYPSQASHTQGRGKILLKGISMKFLVVAYVAQTRAAAGS
jgi:hypothetical protein